MIILPGLLIAAVGARRQREEKFGEPIGSEDNEDTPESNVKPNEA